MSQNSLPCPPQMRNCGLPPAHLSSSSATLLGLPCWLAPPQCTPEQCAPEHASSVTTDTLAHYNTLIINRAIAFYQARLAQMEAAWSAALAKWQRQEDPAHAKVGGPAQELLQDFVFKKILAEMHSPNNKKIWVVWWQDRAHVLRLKLGLANSQILCPPQRWWIHHQIWQNCGRIFKPSHNEIVNYGNVRTSKMPWVMF